MLDIKRLRNEPEEIRKALERRGIEAPLDEFAELDKKRREIIVRGRGEEGSAQPGLGRDSRRQEKPVRTPAKDQPP